MATVTANPLRNTHDITFIQSRSQPRGELLPASFCLHPHPPRHRPVCRLWWHPAVPDLLVLFTGKYPRNWFDTQLGILNWNPRLNAHTQHDRRLSGLRPQRRAPGSNSTSPTGRRPAIRGLRPRSARRPLDPPSCSRPVFRTYWVLLLNFLAGAILFTGRSQRTVCLVRRTNAVEHPNQCLPAV